MIRGRPQQSVAEPVPEVIAGATVIRSNAEKEAAVLTARLAAARLVHEILVYMN